MTEKKKQHFVPQFYLRLFSGDAAAKYVALHVIETGTTYLDAAIRDQAYENYFYGKGPVEDELAAMEKRASGIIHRTISNNKLPIRDSDEHDVLLTFVLFQDARTPAMADQWNEQVEKSVKKVGGEFDDLKEQVSQFRAADPTAPVQALRIAAELHSFGLDLHWKLLENVTRQHFITSDNPAAFCNQFLEKRKPGGGNTGIASLGLQVFLPLGPRHTLMLYDGEVYRVGGRKHLDTHIQLGDEADIAALNTLQAANAQEVLYFHKSTRIEEVCQAIEKARPFRQTEKVALSELPAILPNGKQHGTILQTASVDLRVPVAPSFIVIRSAAAGQKLAPHGVHLRNPERVRAFQEARILRGVNARAFIEEQLAKQPKPR